MMAQIEHMVYLGRDERLEAIVTSPFTGGYQIQIEVGRDLIAAIETRDRLYAERLADAINAAAAEPETVREAAQ